MTVLAATLSADSLSRLEAQVRDYTNSLETACPVIAESVAQVAAQTAKAACPQDTGSLAGSIGVSGDGDGAAEVTASAPYAAFVEFGTGIGSPSGHAKDTKAMGASGYSINASGKGEKGWPYPTDGGFKWTHGQSGKGFMAAGAEEARSRVHEIARRAVRR